MTKHLLKSQLMVGSVVFISGAIPFSVIIYLYPKNNPPMYLYILSTILVAWSYTGIAHCFNQIKKYNSNQS